MEVRAGAPGGNNNSKLDQQHADYASAVGQGFASTLSIEFAQGRVQTAFGPGRVFEPQPIRLPRDSGIAAVLARVADRAADEAFVEGRFADADRLTGLVLELRARADGDRA